MSDLPHRLRSHAEARYVSNSDSYRMLREAASLLDRYREALEWYADQNTYAVTGVKGEIRALDDRGYLARSALTDKEPKT